MTKDEQEKFNEMQLDRAKELSSTAWDGVIYSIQRMDLLVVSISGAGVYVCLETLKFLFEKNACLCVRSNLIGLKLAGVFFIFSIIQNFISQWFATKAHYNTFQSADNTIDQILNKEDRTLQIFHHQKRSEYFDKKARFFDTSSMVTMIIALGLMIISLWVLL